jgi:uncharacterized protein
MQPVDLKLFAKKVRLHKKEFKNYLGEVENLVPDNLYKTMLGIDKQVWQEVDCLTCANCCKKMTPTFTEKDIKRAALYLNISTDEFKQKWLQFNKKDAEWTNVTQPCQFLDLTSNKCSIYTVRPADCSGFPHFTKKNPVLYLHVHQQNVQYCPATFKMVEKMMEKIEV